MIIQSVLDVKDDNPGPKNAGIPALFDRSILILTPARALKFTATSSERHYIWLSALSFLAHSAQAVPADISPQLPTQHFLTKQEATPSYAAQLRKPLIRDSIRVAKGKTPSNISGSASVVSSQSRRTGGSTQGGDSLLDAETFYARKKASAFGEAASPPNVPLFMGRERNAHHSDREYTGLTSSTHSYSQHHRKRSNTNNGRIPPPLTLSHNVVASSEHKGGSGHTPNASSTAGVSNASSSDLYGSERGALSTRIFPGRPSQSGYSSGRTSEMSNRTGAGNNFFDAVGTVRMEAFVTPLAGRHDGIQDVGERDEPVVEWTRAVGAVREGTAKVGLVARKREGVYGNTGKGGQPSDEGHVGSPSVEEEDLGAGQFNPFRGF